MVDGLADVALVQFGRQAATRCRHAGGQEHVDDVGLGRADLDHAAHRAPERGRSRSRCPDTSAPCRSRERSSTSPQSLHVARMSAIDVSNDQRTSLSFGRTPVRVDLSAQMGGVDGPSPAGPGATMAARCPPACRRCAPPPSSSPTVAHGPMPRRTPSRPSVWRLRLGATGPGERRLDHRGRRGRARPRRAWWAGAFRRRPIGAVDRAALPDAHPDPGRALRGVRDRPRALPRREGRAAPSTRCSRLGQDERARSTGCGSATPTWHALAAWRERVRGRTPGALHARSPPWRVGWSGTPHACGPRRSTR